MKTVFDLYVVRTTNFGTTYQDSITHLCDSEEKVTGLIFSCAGYVVQEVYERVLFLLINLLVSIDSDRFTALLDYLTG